ncbi:hypothetical protein Btru_077739 [Bulinus truncatus]|nr:hypothetical protein Btru_077739 [Bulinus truncatus]
MSYNGAVGHNRCVRYPGSTAQRMCQVPEQYGTTDVSDTGAVGHNICVRYRGSRAQQMCQIPGQYGTTDVTLSGRFLYNSLLWWQISNMRNDSEFLAAAILSYIELVWLKDYLDLRHPSVYEAKEAFRRLIQHVRWPMMNKDEVEWLRDCNDVREFVLTYRSYISSEKIPPDLDPYVLLISSKDEEMSYTNPQQFEICAFPQYATQTFFFSTPQTGDRQDNSSTLLDWERNSDCLIFYQQKREKKLNIIYH